MGNYNEMIGDTVATDCGRYEIVAHIYDDGGCDDSINLYVGRAADGHHDLLASDNASMWVVGDEEDAERNRDQWVEIGDRCDVAPVLDDARKIDADLADWLAARWADANTSIVMVDRRSYDAGDMSGRRVVSCETNDDYDAISDCWDSIDADDIIIRGLGINERVMHINRVTDDTRTIDGMADIKADYYVAGYSEEEGDGDCGDWRFFSADGRRLTIA